MVHPDAPRRSARGGSGDADAGGRPGGGDGDPLRAARLRGLGKGQKERIVYLSGDAWAVVARWLAEQPSDPATPLCPNRRGQALTVNGLQERLRHYAAQASVSVRCHQLRHTFARQMVEHAMPVTSLSKMLGHDNLSTTQAYLTGADPALRETYQRAMQAWETDAPAAPPAPPVPAAFPVIASPALPDERAWPTFAEWALDLPPRTRGCANRVGTLRAFNGRCATGR